MKYDMNNDYTLDFNEVSTHLYINSYTKEIVLYTAEDSCDTGAQPWGHQQTRTSGRDLHCTVLLSHLSVSSIGCPGGSQRRLL